MTKPCTSSTAAAIITQTTGHICSESSVRYYVERGRLPYERLPSGIRIYETADVERLAREIARARQERRAAHGE